MIADAVLAIVVGFVLLVLFYIAAFQVITNAGYSGAKDYRNSPLSITEIPQSSRRVGGRLR